MYAQQPNLGLRITENKKVLIKNLILQNSIPLILTSFKNQIQKSNPYDFFLSIKLF